MRLSSNETRIQTQETWIRSGEEPQGKRGVNRGNVPSSTNSNIGPLQDHNASSPRVSNSRSSLDRVCPGMNKVEPCVHTRRFSSDLGHVFLLCPVIGSCTSHNASTLCSPQLPLNDLSVALVFLATRIAITSLNRCCFPRWKS